MADHFCPQCGVKAELIDKFCNRCGVKLRDNCDQDREVDDEKKEVKKVKTFDEFFSAQKQKKQLSVKKSTKSVDVVINIGLIKSTEKAGAHIIRGSKLSVQVKKDFSSGQVIEAAVQKHSAYDQYFCGLEDYLLLYPDQKVVVSIPGTSKKFTVRGYKEALGKPFSKIDLYLCLPQDLICDNDECEGIDDKTDESLTDNKVTLHQNKTSITPSSSITREEQIFYNDITNQNLCDGDDDIMGTTSDDNMLLSDNLNQFQMPHITPLQ